jgi:cyclic pyranopterin phosphate synthase
VKLFAFDGIGEELELLPIAARRALDHAGLKLSREGWRSLPLETRRALVELGSRPEIPPSRVGELVAAAVPAAPAVSPLADPEPGLPPRELMTALGAERPVAPSVWSALTALDRYALVKTAQGGASERLEQAYRELIGTSALSSHLGPQGGARMVSVSDKPSSVRRALAESIVSMSEEALLKLERAQAPKGDVLGTARIAGIQAAKRTWELIPLCHPLALTRADVTFELDHERRAVRVCASVEAVDRTGVEMEALTAASIAALTIYDMLKAFDRGMEIGPTRLLEKSGGRSGDFRR